MAALPEDAPAALGRVVDPVLGGDESGVDPVVDAKRLRAALEEALQFDRQGGKAPVIADHQQRGIGLCQFGLDLGQFRPGEGQRLLAEDVLAGPQPGQGLSGVQVVPGEHRQGIDGRIGDQLVHLTGGVAEAVLFSSVLGAAP